MKRNPRTRYLVAAGALLLLLLLGLLAPERGHSAVRTIGMSLREMLLVIPPIFVLLGLLDVWVSREKLMRHMGPGAGIRGTILAFVMGSAAAGPLYSALGGAFALTRLAANIPAILLMAAVLSRLLTREEYARIVPDSGH